MGCGMRELPVLAVVGGFLGAGKTTLLLRAAALLREGGVRAAVITNDQGEGLVDTRAARAAGFEAGEVAGGCFCCRFSELMDAAGRLLEHQPQVIFAEPVGSCTDIASTVLQPLKALYREQFRLAPFTVLVDPGAARRRLAEEGDSHMAWLFSSQLAEADIVCFTKTDLYSEFPELPRPVDFRVSAETGEGVREWLRELFAGTRIAGGRVLEIDYARYAEAEAALAWLNWQAELLVRRPVSPPCLAGPLLDDLDRALTAAGIEIAHLKVFDEAETGYIRAGLCANGDEPMVSGELAASPARRHRLVLNLRARGQAEAVAAVVRDITEELPGRLTVEHFEYFSPRAPRPEHPPGAKP